MEINPGMVTLFARSMEIALQFIASSSVTTEEYAQYVIDQRDGAATWAGYNDDSRMAARLDAERELELGLRIADALQLLIDDTPGVPAFQFVAGASDNGS